MIVFQSKEVAPDIMPGESSLGVDSGISNFIATSRNELIKSPKFLRSKLKKLKKLQRQLRNKIKGSNNWLKLQKKIAKFNEKVSNARHDWLFKLAHYLCDQTDNIFVESPLTPLIKGGTKGGIWSKGLFRKQSLDSGIGSFLNEILPFVAWKRSKFYLKVNKDFSSQECPFCRLYTGKKLLNQRLHECQYCLAKVDRDYASSLVLEQRGKNAVGQPVNFQMACGGRGAGVLQLTLFDLVTARWKQESPSKPT